MKIKRAGFHRIKMEIFNTCNECLYARKIKNKKLCPNYVFCEKYKMLVGISLQQCIEYKINPKLPH